MKKILTVILATLLLTSCVTQVYPPPEEDVPAPGTEGYLAVVRALYESDPGLSSDAAYFALDLTGVKLLEDTEWLVAFVHEFAYDNGYTFLLNTFEGLVELGYIDDEFPVSFTNGFLISFDDLYLSENRLVTSATKWRSGLGAVGAEFTVEKTFNQYEERYVWEVVEPVEFFMS